MRPLTQRVSDILFMSLKKTSISPLLLALFLLLSSCAYSAKTSELSVTEAQTPSGVLITLNLAEDSLIARWDLGDRVQDFTFTGFEGYQTDRQRDWSFVKTGWVFDGRRLTRADGALFDQFTLKMTQTEKMGIGYYKSVSRIGAEGWLLHSAIFESAGNPFQIRIENLPKDFVFFRSDGGRPHNYDGDRSAYGYFYIGPKAQIVVDKFQFIEADVSNSETFSETVKVYFKEALTLFGERLGQSLGSKPTLILSINPHLSRKGFWGSVSHETIAVRVDGYAENEMGEGLLNMIQTLILHEAFHLWNKNPRAQTSRRSLAWISEGSASYIADRVSLSEVDMYAAIEKNLNTCMLALGPNSVVTHWRARNGRTPYDCGYFIQFMIEIGILRNQKGDILTLWNRLLNRPDVETGYGADELRASFKALADDAALKAYDLFLKGLERDDISAFLTGLNQDGLLIMPLIQTDPPVPYYLTPMTVLRAIIRENCKTGFAIDGTSDRLLLFAEDKCGLTWEGDRADVSFINGVPIMDAPFNAFEMARQACLEGRPIQLEDIQGGKITDVTCSEELMKHPGLFRLSKLPRLPSLSGN